MTPERAKTASTRKQNKEGQRSPEAHEKDYRTVENIRAGNLEVAGVINRRESKSQQKKLSTDKTGRLSAAIASTDR